MKTDAPSLPKPSLVPIASSISGFRFLFAASCVVLLFITFVSIFGIRWLTHKWAGGTVATADVGKEGAWVPVKRGNFDVVCREDGELLPVKVTSIGFTRWGRLSWIAEEGTHVKKGEKVAVLDTEELEQELEAAQDLLAGAERNVAQQEQARDLDAKKFETDLRSARDQVDLSNLKERELLAKPTSLDKEEAANILKGAHAKVESGKADLEAVKPLHDQGYVTETEWDTKKQNFKLAEIEEEGAKLKARKILDGALPEERQRAILDKHAAELALKQKELDWEDARNNYESKIRTAKFQVDQAQKRIVNRKEKIGESARLAPHEGLVVRRPIKWNSDRKVEVGDYVNPWAAPIDLPNYDVMKVRTQVPESVARRLVTRKISLENGPARAGTLARVMVQTLPDVVYPGEVTWIDGWARDRNERLSEADMKAQGLSGLRVFDVEVELKTSDPDRLREGFRATVLIPMETLSNVLSIPRQAVVIRNGHTMARCLRGGDEMWVDVKLGSESNGQVVIQEGLNEGDQVWAPPVQSAPEPKKMQESRPKKAPKPADKAAGNDTSKTDPEAPKKKKLTPVDGDYIPRGGGGVLPPGHP